jgi:perosamine synthetase
VGSRHTGTFGKAGVLSFNGNKVITTGGGGMIITDDEALAKRAEHITTTAKIPHPFEYIHDEIGYNYRLPSLNAAMGCAQMERLPEFLEVKAQLAGRYRELFDKLDLDFAWAREGTTANYWLNAVVLESITERDAFLAYTAEQEIMTRPVWRLMTHLEMFSHCQNDGLENSVWLEERVINLPSSVPDGALAAFETGAKP